MWHILPACDSPCVLIVLMHQLRAGIKLRNFKKIKSVKNLAVPAFACLALLYTLLIFILPPSQKTIANYNLSTTSYRIALFALAIPSFLSWFAAFIGWLKLADYAQSIRKTPEGSDFKMLVKGIGWLAWSLPLTVIISFSLNAFANKWPSFHHTAIILSNYINLILPLIAFTIIGNAARGLVSRSKLDIYLINSRAITFTFVIIGVLYCYLTFQHFDLSSFGSANNPYYLPIWLMVITVTIPYLYAWFVGLLASYEINLFSRNAKGVFYKQAIRYLAIGITIVIVSFIAQQYLNSVKPRVGYLVFDYRLMFTLALKILTGVGFAVLAFGAYRLKRIEEI